MSQSKSRDQQPAKYQWDLSLLYACEADWQADYEKAQTALTRYQQHKGKMGGSVEGFKAALFFDLEVSRIIEKVYTYAHLIHDQDQSDQHNQALYQQAVLLATEAAQLSSFMTPEMLAIEEGRLAEFLKDPELADFGFYIRKIIRNRPHTRSETEEELIAMSRKMAQTPSQVFRQLDDVDLDFGHIEHAGRQMPLTHGNFMTHLTQADRELRRKAFTQYYRAYDNHRHTIASALSGSIQNDLFYARAKKFDSCRQAALFSDDVPEHVYDNLIQSVRSNLAPLFSYLRFRKEALALDELHFYDTYVPIVASVDFEMPYDSATETCLAALAPLGNDYVDRLREGFASRWVDCFENTGKRSGAYSSGCYDSPPYMLMNYESANLNSLFTLIHEAGHSMHSDYANRHQPYHYHGYTIFVAEVASTFNEILLSHYLLRKYADNPAMRAYVLTREIDNIRATLFRQTMFAEFELKTHSLAEQRQPVTLEALTTIYADLLGDYFGDTLVIDKDLHLECLRIPHFYSAFYVYKYATGIAAAIALAQGVLNGQEGATERYLGFLKSGGKDDPLPLLASAGVDLREPQPIEAAINFFADRVTRLKALYPQL